MGSEIEDVICVLKKIEKRLDRANTKKQLIKLVWNIKLQDLENSSDSDSDSSDSDSSSSESDSESDSSSGSSSDDFESDPESDSD
jgi:hypothetical protein